MPGPIGVLALDDGPAHRVEDDLDRRIAEVRAKHVRGDSSARAETKGWAMGIEFVGAVLVSTFIGWAIDRWAGTMPWGMLVFLVLGLCAGVRSAMKAASAFGEDTGGPQADPQTGEGTSDRKDAGNDAG